MSTLEEDLRAVVGPGHVLADPDLRAPYEQDWTGRFGGPARLVVRPADAGEVSAALRACHAHGAPVVPQGGNTGLVGAGVPRGGEVLVSLARLSDIGPVDAATHQVEAGAGATLAALHEHAAKAGLEFGVDFGARDSASVGGMIATDAGGVRALRHGTMRAQVLGLEAVLADGSVMRRLSGLPKDNAGYDLPALLCGSEGTLAVICRARLRLLPRMPARVTALLAVAGLEDALALVEALRRDAPSLCAADFMLDDGLDLVLRHRKLAAPLRERAPAYVLAECAALTDPTAELAAAVEAAGVVRDAAVADDTAGRAALWGLREALPEAIAAAGIPHKLDVGVPAAALAEFAVRVRERVSVAAPGARVWLFGHLGDGNVHVNIVGPDPGDEAVDEAVLRLAAELGGTISAEHGVGVAKARWLGLTRSDEELGAMSAIKRGLDPGGLLNPGAVLER